MQPDSDTAYYRRREATARELEARSKDPAISRIHREMADRYADLACRAQPHSVLAKSN